MSNETARVMLNGETVLSYTPSKGQIVSVMTIPSKVIAALALQFFGHEHAGHGCGPGAVTEQIAEHVFKTTHKFEINEMVRLPAQPGDQDYCQRWTLVDTRSQSFEWEAISDYSANYAADGALKCTK